MTVPHLQTLRAALLRQSRLFPGRHRRRARDLVIDRAVGRVVHLPHDSRGSIACVCLLDIRSSK
jgi:hypothetical protein